MSKVLEESGSMTPSLGSTLKGVGRRLSVTGAETAPGLTLTGRVLDEDFADLLPREETEASPVDTVQYLRLRLHYTIFIIFDDLKSGVSNS